MQSTEGAEHRQRCSPVLLTFSLCPCLLSFRDAAYLKVKQMNRYCVNPEIPSPFPLSPVTGGICCLFLKLCFVSLNLLSLLLQLVLNKRRGEKKKTWLIAQRSWSLTVSFLVLSTCYRNFWSPALMCPHFFPLHPNSCCGRGKVLLIPPREPYLWKMSTFPSKKNDSLVWCC